MLLLLAVVLIAGIMLGRHVFPMTQPPKEPLTTLEEEWVTVSLLPENKYSRPGLPLRQVNGIVIHYTANPGTTAEQTVSYFSNLAQTGETFASSHFVIGMDGTVIQCIPLDEESYCSNDRNGDTIAIECCHPDSDGAFTDETYQSLVRLTRYLVQAYALEEEQVIRHYDITGKECPLYFVVHEDAWTDFRTEVFSGIHKWFWPF